VKQHGKRTLFAMLTYWWLVGELLEWLLRLQLHALAQKH
jgi:hypothetical protein